MAIYLTEDDVDSLLSLPETMDAVEAAFADQARGDAGNHPRQRFFLPDGVLHHMAAHWSARGVMGTKTYTSYADGTRFFVQLFSSQTGDLLALLEANVLGQRRTGAATGVAARRMAASDATVAALLGTGFQAETQAEALLVARPALRHVRVFGRDLIRRREFCMAMTLRLGIHFEPAESVEDAVRGAHMIACATTARDPILKGEWIHDGAFVAAVGANRLTAREIDEATVARAALVVVDDPAQARTESAELVAACERRRFVWERAVPLSELAAGRVSGRPAPDAVTLFKSLGVALEDVAAAAVVYEKATALGIGRPL